MVYAVPSDRVLLAKRKVQQKRVLSPEMKEFLEFYDTHDFLIHVSEDRSKAEITAIPKTK